MNYSRPSWDSFRRSWFLKVLNKFMSQLLILTSPPASGKTFMIRALSEDLKIPILVIVPLRALVEEGRKQWPKNIYVMTPEEWALNKDKFPIVIIDEFHLNFYWGDTFRPIMWEVFYEISQATQLMLVLTATMNEMMIQEMRSYFCTFDEIIWFNAGNQKLKFYPVKYVKFSDSSWPQKNLHLLPHTGVTLIFCQYRQQVKWWEDYLHKKGFICLSCIGGEASEFSLKLSQMAKLDFIIATTVLSHGVNLPSIGRICFTYKTKNIDFWIQMVARGGRKGENFEVYSPEAPYLIDFSRISNAFFLFRMKFRMMLLEIWEDIQAWFLKASS